MPIAKREKGGDIEQSRHDMRIRDVPLSEHPGVHGCSAWEYDPLMAAITTTEAKSYLARWESVEAMKLAALRRTSMEVKLVQLAALMASRELFCVDSERETGVQLVRDRWARVRRAMCG
jgi:hypothetical protein